MPNAAVSDTMQPLLVARAAIQNAADLLEDAEQLAQRARWGTAYALAAFAFEEIGKTMLYLLPVFNPTITQAELDKDLRHHPTKLTAAFALLQVIGMSQPEPVATAFGRAAALAPDVHQAKMRGFYIDAAADGTYMTPADVTESEAVELIRDLGMVADALRPWLTDEALEKLTELASSDEFRQRARHAARYADETVC